MLKNIIKLILPISLILILCCNTYGAVTPTSSAEFGVEVICPYLLLPITETVDLGHILADGNPTTTNKDVVFVLSGQSILHLYEVKVIRHDGSILGGKLTMDATWEITDANGTRALSPTVPDDQVKLIQNTSNECDSQATITVTSNTVTAATNAEPAQYTFVFVVQATMLGI